MPSRNIVKIYADKQYYHIYNRGVNKSDIFLDGQDYSVFLSLLKRHLSKEPAYDKYHRPFKHIHNDVALLTYCLMPNHFHLLVLNVHEKGVKELMQSVATAYARYFNRRYDRVGPVFQSNFKASHIDSDQYLQHISRYIHLNPSGYKSYPYSSYQAIVKGWNVEWLSTEKLLETFEGTVDDYAKFVADYEANKEIMDELKYELADQ